MLGTQDAVVELRFVLRSKFALVAFILYSYIHKYIKTWCSE